VSRIASGVDYRLPGSNSKLPEIVSLYHSPLDGSHTHLPATVQNCQKGASHVDSGNLLTEVLGLGHEAGKLVQTLKAQKRQLESSI
jgi:hypothetical protein